MAKKVKQWYTLDNAGVLYAALQRREYSAIYRFSAVMTEKVDAAALQRAIDRLRPRFPGFFSRIIPCQRKNLTCIKHQSIHVKYDRIHKILPIPLHLHD